MFLASSLSKIEKWAMASQRMHKPKVSWSLRSWKSRNSRSRLFETLLVFETASSVLGILARQAKRTKWLRNVTGSSRKKSTADCSSFMIPDKTKEHKSCFAPHDIGCHTESECVSETVARLRAEALEHSEQAPRPQKLRRAELMSCGCRMPQNAAEGREERRARACEDSGKLHACADGCSDGPEAAGILGTTGHT